MQQLVYEKAMSAPIWELVFISGVGPRVGEAPSEKSEASRTPRRSRI